MFIKRVDQDAIDRKLAKLWAFGHSCEFIAEKLGYNHGSSISHAARRLGLPKRYGTTEDTVQAKQERNERRQAKEDAMLDRVVALLKPVPINAKWWRCPHCEGRGSDRLGHELCITRQRLREAA